MLIDLHTHSCFSDGTLTPAQLVAEAAARAVRVLALTDHDSTAGHTQAREACASTGIHFIPGVEATAGWRGQEIHVVGLGVDAAHPVLVAHLGQVVALRRERMARLCERLQRTPALAASLAPLVPALLAQPVPTRTHLARALVQAGAARDPQAAFRRHLAAGARGHVATAWPDLATTIAAVHAAGGHAVLAHAHRYRLSAGALRNLCSEFAALGGDAMEVSLPGLSPGDATRLCELARQNGLAGSAGSDFHVPGQRWRPLGRFAKLPDHVEPLLPRLMAAA